MTKIIGLTGGIGSGKTRVAKYIESLGVPVYIADDEAKKIMTTNDVIQAITKEFGNEVVENKILNREKLALLVFTNPKKTRKIE